MGPNVEPGGPLRGPKGPMVSLWKNKRPTPPLAPGGFGPKTWVWEGLGAKVIVIRAEKPSSHTNSARSVHIWTWTHMGDG